MLDLLVWLLVLLWFALVYLLRRLVEFLVVNLLALVCFELARLSLFLGLLGYFTMVWFVGLEGLFCFCLLALLCFDCLCWFACLVCFALQ